MRSKVQMARPIGLERWVLAITVAWLAAFGCWTVLTHAVVFSESSFDQLARWSWVSVLVALPLALFLARRNGDEARVAIVGETNSADDFRVLPIVFAVLC